MFVKVPHVYLELQQAPKTVWDAISFRHPECVMFEAVVVPQWLFRRPRTEPYPHAKILIRLKRNAAHTNSLQCGKYGECRTFSGHGESVSILTCPNRKPDREIEPDSPRNVTFCF